MLAPNYGKMNDDGLAYLAMHTANALSCERQLTDKDERFIAMLDRRLEKIRTEINKRAEDPTYHSGFRW